ncbi:cytochrome b pre-mRNA-processing protein 3 [Rhodobium orientis]|nr:ubiquinol-cytochrome C chaperone family protein [Rhodobium orientis]MBB4304808.1 cytochrome b pre-mRNA-processing protein 3 [Rhodobium orientis]
MILGLFGGRKDTRIDGLYAAIMAQARQPSLYTDHEVPDTLNGRFELLLLHVILVLYRLKSEDAATREKGRQLSERFFTDMDGTLREMGVGDLSVPKKIKKMAKAYFGRLGAYDGALDHDADQPEDLVAVIDRNVFPDAANLGAAATLAAYVRATERALAATSVEDVLGARIAWPDPAAFADAGGESGAGETGQVEETP